MKINESEIWKYITKLSHIERERIFDQFTSEIEQKLNCKIVDRSFMDLQNITNPSMTVQDTIRNICYLKEFVPNKLNL